MPPSYNPPQILQARRAAAHRTANLTSLGNKAQTTHPDRSAPCRRLRAAIEAIARPVFAAWAAFIGGRVAVSRRARATTTSSPDYCSIRFFKPIKPTTRKSRCARRARRRAKPSPVRQSANQAHNTQKSVSWRGGALPYCVAISLGQRSSRQLPIFVISTDSTQFNR
jgi:hypothetical protein